jgi:single-strand DNA-binding protein
MNKIFLIGNLTRDPELSETASGVAVCHFAIAVNRNYTGQDGERQTDFFNCTAWRGQAETIARFCKKGHKVAVTGSIQMRNYDDNQGVKRTAVDIIVQDVEFLTPKAGEEDMDEPRAATPKRKPVLQAMDDDSDIPF